MDEFEHQSDEELLGRTADEPEAFGAFYRRHVGGVLAFFRRRTGDTQLALDLTGETFARALEQADRSRASERSPTHSAAAAKASRSPRPQQIRCPALASR